MVASASTGWPFGVPGLRIGWFAAPEETVQAAWGVRDYVSLMAPQAERMNRLIEDLLAYSRLSFEEQATEAESSLQSVEGGAVLLVVE